MQIFEVFSNETKVGILEISAIGRNETYYFTYDKSWLKNGFELGRDLPLSEGRQISKALWSAFCDICPDRWGELLQTRNNNGKLTKSGYMLGVSDIFRIGSLRLKLGGHFVSQTNNIPKLSRLNELRISAQNIEKGTATPQDMENLLAPSGSLGGARPKVSIYENNELYILKLPSINDDYFQVSNCEKTLLDLARIAKINTCNARLIETINGAALLVKRFDRDDNGRIPYKSAMTLLGVKDGENSQNKSYVDLAFCLDKENKIELFRRMVFNGLFGNTDDHLRNHGVLLENGKWNLSPAFDLTPMMIEYHKQRHALNFVDDENLPSVELFYEIREFFGVNDKKFCEILGDMLRARDNAEQIARHNGISGDNLKMLRHNYTHDDFKIAENLIKKLKDSAKNHLGKITR